MEQLEVSDMTARRDLDELEKSGKLLRVHGGAQSLSFSMDHERSHLEKIFCTDRRKKQELRIKQQVLFKKEKLYS